MKGRRTVVVSLLAAAMVVASAGPAHHGDWGPEPPVAPYGLSPLPKEHSVCGIIFPLIGGCRWSDDFGVPRGKFLHTGIDIKAPKMTPIVAPFSGTLGMKTQSFWIFADNGWAMLGTHLNDDNLGKHDHAGSRDLMFAPGLIPGQKVHSGQFIGYVGMSGDATGPHLHFELYAPGPPPTASRIRNPFPSLKMAQYIKAPVVIPPAEKPDKGDLRIQGCVRKVEPDKHQLTMIVAAREFSNGITEAFTHIRYLRVHVTDEVAQAAGGWDAITHAGDEHLMGVFVPDTNKLDDSTAEKILL